MSTTVTVATVIYPVCHPFNCSCLNTTEHEDHVSHSQNQDLRVDKTSLFLSDASEGFISSQRAFLSSFLFLSPHETDTCSFSLSSTLKHADWHKEPHWQQIPMKCLNVVNKGSAWEWKEEQNKKQISNEIITIQREEKMERQKKESRVATMVRNNCAASMEKEGWWWGGGLSGQ